MNVKWNLNNIIRFRISEKGRKIWCAHLREVRGTDDRLINYGAEHDMHGEMRMQFWDFAQVFGRHLVVGLGNPCDMNVVLESAEEFSDR